MLGQGGVGCQEWVWGRSVGGRGDGSGAGWSQGGAGLRAGAGRSPRGAPPLPQRGRTPAPPHT